MKKKLVNNDAKKASQRDFMIIDGSIRILRYTALHTTSPALVGRISTWVLSPAFRGKRYQQDVEHLNIMVINR